MHARYDADYLIGISIIGFGLYPAKLLAKVFLMMKRILPVFCAVGLLAATYERFDTTATMVEAAKSYLAALTPQQKPQATIPFASEERTNWHYIPLDNRKGIPLREMAPEQKQLAEALISAGYSRQGIIKAHTIRSLEQVLKETEKGTGPERDTEKYFVSIYGEPSEKGTWGYRFEGHHVSVSFTVVDGKVVSSSPNFFGANPAEVKTGPRAGLRALKREEDLGLELIQSMTPAQREIAIVDKKAANEILTANSRKAALNGQPNGLPFSQMSAQQKEILTALVSEYAENFPAPIAEARMDKFNKSKANLYFAWMGGINRGDPHYYRIQTPTFLIEYDNVQNNANHIHSVWRDFNGDFGLDLLAQHLQASHK